MRIHEGCFTARQKNYVVFLTSMQLSSIDTAKKE